MTKKTIQTISVIILLGGLSLYLNRDRFTPDVIQLSHRSLTPRGWLARPQAAKDPANEVIFLLSRSLRLEAVKVALVSDAETNKFPHAIWSLVSDSNSLPVKEFIYGMTIRGMRLEHKGVGADPLQPGTSYRIFVQAGSDKLQHDFIPTPRAR